MKEEEIEQMSKAFANYFTRKAKRVLKLKNKDFDSVHIDYFSDTASIWVWFHRKTKDGIVGRVDFTLNGKRKGA